MSALVVCPHCGGKEFSRRVPACGFWLEWLAPNDDGTATTVNESSTDDLSEGRQPATMKCDTCGKKVPNPDAPARPAKPAKAARFIVGAAPTAPAAPLSRWVMTRKAHLRWRESGMAGEATSRATFCKRAEAAGVRRWSIGYDGRWWNAEDLGRLLGVANIPVSPSDRYGEPPEATL